MPSGVRQRGSQRQGVQCIVRKSFFSKFKLSAVEGRSIWLLA